LFINGSGGVLVRYQLGNQKDSGSSPRTGSFSSLQMPGISKYF
jgi:hypothetical protein